tara:strand:- start:12340 stop:12591 length:252 start_codon:yes stop_codon:yes gene_type:complete
MSISSTITHFISPQVIDVDNVDGTFDLGDPQDSAQGGQSSVPTEKYFTFDNTLSAVTGIKAEIIGLQVLIPYSVSLGEFVLYE